MKTWISFFLLFGLVILVFSTNQEQQSLEGIDDDSESLTSIELMSQLGCEACHTDLPSEDSIFSHAPYLDFAGTKFQAAYLFDYISNPVKIRHNIGHARMPDFHLSDEESLALTLYLSSQTLDSENMSYPNFKHGSSNKRKAIDRGRTLLNELTCTTCHQINGAGTLLISELSTIGYRLQPEWVKMYMVSPQRFNRSHQIMPELFYEIRNEEFTERFPEAQQNIEDITAYLFSLNQDHRKNLSQKFNSIKKENTHVTRLLGEQIYINMNCAGCHEKTVERYPGQIAPNLTGLTDRVKPSFLASYLKNPVPIRPAGFIPGQGSRMPDYKLSDQEVELIFSHLDEGPPEESDSITNKLSVFSMQKAESLIKQKYACLGCHQLDGQGGKIGPSLDLVGERLQPQFVYDVIKSPHEAIPWSIMPKTILPDKTIHLIANFLIQRENHDSTAYLSMIDLESDLGLELVNADYQLNCAPCHGIAGKGDGFNASFLNIVPTDHSDPSYISLKPDDSLFDGIYSGGYILHKSNHMPGFGQSLTHEQITGLVSHIRALCSCEGPEWSTDN